MTGSGINRNNDSTTINVYRPTENDVNTLNNGKYGYFTTIVVNRANDHDS